MNRQAAQSQRPSLVLVKNSEILSVGAMPEIKEGMTSKIQEKSDVNTYPCLKFFNFYLFTIKHVQ